MTKTKTGAHVRTPVTPTSPATPLTPKTPKPLVAPTGVSIREEMKKRAKAALDALRGKSDKKKAETPAPASPEPPAGGVRDFFKCKVLGKCKPKKEDTEKPEPKEEGAKALQPTIKPKPVVK